MDKKSLQKLMNCETEEGRRRADKELNTPMTQEEFEEWVKIDDTENYQDINAVPIITPKGL